MTQYEITLSEYLQEIDAQEERALITRSMNETIREWSKEVPSLKIYQRYDWENYQHVIFNSEKNKALLLVGFIKKSQHGKIDLYTAQKSGEKWEFKYRGLPSFSYEYDAELRENTPFTVPELMSLTLDKLCEDGLIKNNNISQTYINEKWF